MFRTWMMIAFLVLIGSSVDTASTKAADETITPDNASEIILLSHMGSPAQGQIAWSPGGQTIGVGTSAGVSLIDASSGQVARKIESGYTDVEFNATGDVLASGGVLWQVETGEKLLTVEDTTSVNSSFSPGGNFYVTSEAVGDEVTLKLWNVREPHTSPLRFDLGIVEFYDGVVFNPDETTMAVKLRTPLFSYHVAAVQLWEVASGKQIALMNHDGDAFKQVEFSPDGHWLVTWDEYSGPKGFYGSVRLWDGHTGKFIFGESSPSGGMFNSDSSQLAFNEEIYLLNKFQRIDLHLGAYFTKKVLFSPQGNFLGWIDSKQVYLWDSRQLSKPPITFEIREWGEFVREMAFSPDERFIAVKEWGNLLRVWSTQTGEEVWSRHADIFPSAQPGIPVMIDLNFTPDAQLLWERYPDGQVRFWNTSNGDPALILPRNAVISPDVTLAAYWDDGLIKLLDIQAKTWREIPIIEDYVGETLALHPATEQIAFFENEDVHIYDIHTQSISSIVPIDFSVSSVEASFSPDGHQFLYYAIFSVPGRRGEISIAGVPRDLPPTSLIDMSVVVDISSFPVETFVLRHTFANPVFRPDGLQVVTTPYYESPPGWDGSIQVWNATNGEILGEWLVQGISAEQIFSPDGRFLLTGTHSGSVRLWDIDETLIQKIPIRSGSQWIEGITRTIIRNNRTLSTFSQVKKISFSPDSQWMSVDIFEHKNRNSGIMQAEIVYVWKVEDVLAESEVESREDENTWLIEGMQTAGFNPDGSLLATKAIDSNTLSLWDTATREEVAVLPGDALVAFSPDGDLLAVQSSEGVVIWEVKALIEDSTSPLMTIPSVYGLDAVEITFSPDGKTLYIRTETSISAWGLND
jgi:WD40 repeat protein